MIYWLLRVVYIVYLIVYKLRSDILIQFPYILHNRKFYWQSVSCHQPVIADLFGDYIRAITQLQNIVLKMSVY